MNQDSSFPPMLPPSTELGALLFAILPCLQDTYRPLASFAYHMTELTRLKTIPSVPPLAGMSDIDALITDKDLLLRSLTLYGKLFHMPLLSTIATLLQGWQFYQAYKDILPGLFSGPGNSASTNTTVPPGNGGFDLFSMLGGLSPDLLSSLFSGFSGSSAPHSTASPSDEAHGPTVQDSEAASQSSDISDDTPVKPAAASNTPAEDAPPTDDLYNSLYSFLTPEQQKIYEQLMHTD